MLFEFSKFWKTLAIVMSSWIIYGLWGFEFTAITCLGINIVC